MVTKIGTPSGKWKKTTQTGVRYREHHTRRHGTKLDRYYQVRFKVAGKTITECYGWASEGWTLKKVAATMAEMRVELKEGKNRGKLADRRKALQVEQEQAHQEEAKQAMLAVTYADYFNDNYQPTIEGKKGTTKAGELSQHRLWIIPAIGRIPVKDIVLLHVGIVFTKMTKAGLTPRTIQHALGCMRMVMVNAAIDGYHHGANPVDVWKKKNKGKLKFDNRRIRFFSHDEADELLESLAAKSKQVHDMTLLSIHCGLRAGEVFSLSWSDVDQGHRLITLRDTKSGRTRTVNMTKAVKTIFQDMAPGRKSALVFPGKKGQQRKQMSKTYNRTVDWLGLNDGLKDSRQRVCFHTCRHTCASWLVMSGVALYQVKEIMGHSTIAMTERYAHLAPDGAKAAVSLMEKAIEASKQKRETQDVANIR